MRKILIPTTLITILTSLCNAETKLMEEVFITANDRGTPLRALNIAGNKLTYDDIISTAAIHPSELLNRLPGINIQRGSGQEHLSAIRSPVLTGGSGAGSFLYLVNNIPIRSAGFANVNSLFETPTELANSIEVIKGPGSVVHGSNAQHGLINIITKKPNNIRSNEGNIRLGEEGFFAGRISSSAATWAFGAYAARDGGFRNDSGFNQQKVVADVEKNIGSWQMSTMFSAQSLSQETAGFIFGEDAYRDVDLITDNEFPEAFRDSKSLLTAVRFEHSTPNDGILSLTPYVRHIDMEFLRHFVPGQALEKNGHSSLGLRVNHSRRSERQSTMLGVDIDVTRGFLREVQEQPTVFSFVQGEHYDYDVNSLSIGIFGQRDWLVRDGLTLDVGLRADYTFYDYSTNITPGTSGRFQVLPSQHDNFIALTPRLGFTQVINEKLSVYGRLARGARAPQTSDLYSLQVNQEAQGAEVETLDSVEYGIRYSNAKVDFDVAAFFMRKRNFFFRDSDGFNEENGKTSHYGIDASIDISLSNELSISSSLSYARHKYRFTRDVSRAVNTIKDGNYIDTAPQTLGSLILRYQSAYQLKTEVEWRHMGEYFLDPSNTHRYPGHDILVVRTEYRVLKNLALSARIDNLTDNRYADRADFAFSSYRYFPGRPRTVFIAAKFSF